jgi:hypothetical protein
MLHLLKTIENQDFEVPLISVGKKKLLQMWYQLDGPAQPLCYGLQPNCSHSSRFKVWNKIYVFNKNSDN